MINLNELRDRLDNMLNQETTDSLNQWLNNKRNNSFEQLNYQVNFMDEIVIARVQLISVLDDVKSLTHDLTIGELDALIDEVTVLYERFNNDINTRKGEQPK